jgi:hypothetical protein
MKGRPGRIGLGTAIALAFVALAAPSALANYVYWPNLAGGTIGRAGLDGSQVNNAFIATTETPRSVAVDSQYIYWTQGTTGTGAIGRAKLDGTDIQPNFIPHSASGPYAPIGIAVTATHIYWANSSGPSNIGRANLDGSQPNNDFINDPNSLCGLAVDKNFLYYTAFLGGSSAAVARVPIGGGTPDDNFIPVPGGKDCGVAVDDSHVYFTSGLDEIARADLNGTNVDPKFIPGTKAGGVAVTPQYVFWGTGAGDHSVGRANIDGTGANEFFAHPASDNSSTPYLLAASPSNSFTLGKLKRKSNGTAVLKATVQGPGVLVADAASKGTQAVVSKKKSTVKRVQVTAGKAGTYKLKIRAKGKALEKLNTTGKAKLTLGITFTPQGVAGIPLQQKKKVKLKRG